MLNETMLPISNFATRRGCSAGRCLAVILAFCAGSAVACDDPSVHPELAAYAAARVSLGAQIASPVEVRYRMAGERVVGVPVTVQLSFLYDEGQEQPYFTVTPSPGIGISGLSRRAEVPRRGVIEFQATARRNGYHYLTVETVVADGDDERRHRTMLPFPIEAIHAESPGGGGTDGEVFAAARLRGTPFATRHAPGPGQRAEAGSLPRQD